MRGSVGHAPPHTRRAEASALTGKRDNPIQSAGVAVHSQETSGQNAAIKKRAQFPFDEARHQPVALPLPGQEGFQMGRNNTVKNRRFGIAGDISHKAFADGGVLIKGYGIAIAVWILF
jgi:hypothetical protein